MRKQFYELYNKNIYLPNLLAKLNDHKLKNGGRFNKKMLKKLIKYPDEKIYNILRTMYVHENCFSGERGNKMAYHIVNIIKSLNIKPSSLLDYGCANGTISKELAQQLNISLFYGADITPINNPDFNFILLKNSNLMPTIKDNSIDFINTSMVLHHVQDIETTLIEFKRIITDNGILVIREHDCPNKDFATFLDILHGLYAVVWSEPIEDPNFVHTYQAYYKTYQNWDKLLWKFGFEKIYFKQYPLSLINAYYAVYKPIIIKNKRII